MNFVVDQLSFLGLNKREVKVFTALATFGQMNMTKLAERAGLARTTVDAIVRRLVEQGLVSKEKVGGHYEYSVCLEEVGSKLSALQEKMHKSVKTGESTACAPGEVDVVISTKPNNDEKNVINSHSDLHSFMESEFQKHKGDRVTMLTSSLLNTHERVERMRHCLEYAAQAEVKLEILASATVAKELASHAHLFATIFDVHIPRLNILPPSFCIENTDLVAFRDAVLVVDHRHNTVERVEGRAVLAIFHLLMVSRESGWSMDLDLWLKGV